ncbi:MAG: sulfite exporter TauE/SafE family protein, partial [Lysobacterales bacterium]
MLPAKGLRGSRNGRRRSFTWLRIRIPAGSGKRLRRMVARAGGRAPMLLEFALIGVLAGYLAGLLGIGGGFVVVPALTFLFLDQADTAPWAVHMAVATSLATMLVTSLSSIFAHHRRHAIRWPVVRSLAGGLLAGAVLGALIADALEAAALSRVFGFCAVFAGLQLVLGRNP